MAINIWVSAGSTNGLNGANWSLGVLSVTDILTFDNASSTVTCILGTLTFAGFNMTAGYTGQVRMGIGSYTCTGDFTVVSTSDFLCGTSNLYMTGATGVLTSGTKPFYNVYFNNVSGVYSSADDLAVNTIMTIAMSSFTFAGYTITSSGPGPSFNGAGTLSLGNIIMNNASSTLTFANTLGTVTSATCDLTMNGTTSMSITNNKGIQLQTLTLGPGAKVNIAGTATTVFQNSTSPIIFSDGGTLTTTKAISVYLTGSSDFISILGAAPTWVQGTTGRDLFRCLADGIVGTLPAMTFSGTDAGGITLDVGTVTTNYDAEVKLGGNLTVSRSAVVVNGVIQIDMCTNGTFSTQDYNITAPDCTLQTGGSGSGTASVFNWGNSVIAMDIFLGNVIALNSVVTDNYQKSQWFVERVWQYGTKRIVNHSWNSVTFTGTAAILSNGKNFNYLYINAPGKIVKLDDDLICHGYSLIDGTLNQNGKKFSVNGDLVKVEELLAII